MTIMSRAGGDGKTQSGPMEDADGISAELRLAADDLAVALLRLLRAVASSTERGQAHAARALPGGVQDRGQDDELGRMAYTVPEAARLLGVSRALLAEQIRASHIPTFQIGRRVLVSRAELERLAAGADAESRRVVELMADRRRKKR